MTKQRIITGTTVWLNRQQLTELFGRDIKTIGKHIGNVFSEGELDKAATVAKFATVQQEGDRSITRNIEYYILIQITISGCPQEILLEAALEPFVEATWDVTRILLAISNTSTQNKSKYRPIIVPQITFDKPYCFSSIPHENHRRQYIRRLKR